jgi:hypothetical protein
MQLCKRAKVLPVDRESLDSWSGLDAITKESPFPESALSSRRPSEQQDGFRTLLDTHYMYMVKKKKRAEG